MMASYMFELQAVTRCRVLLSLPILRRRVNSTIVYPHHEIHDSPLFKYGFTKLRSALS